MKKIIVGLMVLLFTFGVVVSVAAEMVQVGMRVEPSVLGPRASRFSFVSGVKKIFTGIKQVWLKLLNLLCLFLVFLWFFHRLTAAIPGVFFASAGERLSFMFTSLMLFAAVGCCSLLVLAAVDTSGHAARNSSMTRTLNDGMIT